MSMYYFSLRCHFKSMVFIQCGSSLFSKAFEIEVSECVSLGFVFFLGFLMTFLSFIIFISLASARMFLCDVACLISLEELRCRCNNYIMTNNLITLISNFLINEI